MPPSSPFLSHDAMNRPAAGAAALLIAVETYPDSALDLVGPADDAIKMRRWLLDFGGVRPEYLTVLVSSRGGWADAELVDGPANLDTVLACLRDLSTLGVERIYFYFSGHGLAVATDPERQYLLLSDFHSRDAPHKALVLEDVARYLRIVADEYLIFSDACRNFPYEWRPVNIATPFSPDWGAQDLPTGRTMARGGEISAASPGGVAYIQRSENATFPTEEPGVSIFTAALLDGLAGKGKAKCWDPSRQCYVVDTTQLQRYVGNAVRSRLAAVTDVDLELASSAIAFRNTQDPLVLREIARADVADVRLSVDLAPDAVGQAQPMVELKVDEIPYKCWQPDGPVVHPVAPFEAVQPRCYVLAAQASGYEQETVPLTCEPYEDAEETVRLVPIGGQGGGPGGPPGPRTSVGPDGGDGVPGTLAIRSEDPVAPYLVTSEAGKPAAVGAGDDAHSLPTGFFRVRPLVGGTGAFGDHLPDRYYDGSITSGPEWLVHVAEGAESRVALPSARALPSRLHSALLDFFDGREDIASERWRNWFGAQPSPPVSSLLAFLGELLTLEPRPVGYGPMSRPLALPRTAQPVFVLLAVDGGDEEESEQFMSRIQVRFRAQRQPGALQTADFRQFAVAGVRVARLLASAGALTIRVGPADGEVVDVRVPCSLADPRC